jgi:hypothetical protein
MIVGILLIFTWLVLLIRYPAKALPVSGAALALLAVVAAWVIWQQKHLDHQLERLKIRVVYDTSQCSSTKPLSVSVENTNDAVMSSLSWRIAAYFPGETSNLAQRDYARPQYQAPAGIQPGETWSECLATPPLRPGYRPETLEYRAEALEGVFD